MATTGKRIITGTVGSHAYGTATPTSDTDLMSVIVAPADVYLGLKHWGNSGTMDHHYDDPENGFVEHKYFELKKTMSMFANFNPNIIPLLWLQPEHYEVITPEGQLLLDNRELFNSKRAYHTFSGYAHGQLQKMGGVFNDAEEPNKLLKAGYGRFEHWAAAEVAHQRHKRDNPVKKPWCAEQALDVYDEGYLNALIALRTHATEECKRIKDGPITGRMGKKRKELREKYGYDVKFAFHTIRLMRMCNEFLRNPQDGLKVYRVGIDAEFLYSIRTGALSQEDVKKMADDLFAEARELVKTSPLPDQPDEVAIHNLTIDLLKMTLKEELTQ